MPDLNKKPPFYADGLRFSCKRCSQCCRHESGFVFLSEKDVVRMAEALKIGCEEFSLSFCRWIPQVNGIEQLSLKEKSNLDCILWAISAGANADGGCSVYESRPLQCRSFPFWPSMLNSSVSWEAAAKDCPGIGQGSLHNLDSILEWIAIRQNEPIMSRKA